MPKRQLVLLLAFALTACGSHAAPTPAAPAPVPVPEPAPAPAPEPAPPTAPPGPSEWPITIHNATRKPIVIVRSGCNGPPGWLRLSTDGESLMGGGRCNCETFPDGNCPVFPAVCAPDQHETLKPGASFAYTWNATKWVPDPKRGCAVATKLPADQKIDVEVCWLDKVPDRESREIPTPPQCKKVSTTLATPGVTVEVEP